MPIDFSAFSMKLAGTCVRYRLPLSVVSCVAVSALASGLLLTRFDGTFNALLTQSDPYLEELELLDKEFPIPTEAAFIFVAAEGRTVFNKATLQAIGDLRQSYAAVPKAAYLSTILDWISPETQSRLFAKKIENYTEYEFSTLAQAAVQDRLLTNSLLSPDASLTFGNLKLTARDASTSERLEIATAIQQLRDDIRQRHPGVEMYVGSDMILEQSSQSAMIEDLTSLLPFVIIICVLIICLCFRSLTLGACILVHVVVTVICNIGMVNYLDFSFNNISIIAPLVVIIIAVANSVHIISIHKQALASGMGRLAAMEHSLSYNFQPVSLATLTTAIGFSSLNMTSSPAIQDFGQIVAIGIVFAYGLSFTMLPATMVWFTSLGHKNVQDQTVFMQRLLERVITFTNKYDKPIFLIFTCLALGTAALLPLNKTDFNRLDFIANEGDIREYYDKVAEKMNRGPALTYAIKTTRADGVIDIDFLQEVEIFTSWLGSLESVESTASLNDVLKTINQFVNDQKPEYFFLPETKDAVENYLDAFRLVNSREFPISGFVSDDLSAMTVFINATQISNQELLNLDREITQKFSEVFTDATLIHGSELLLFSRMDDLVTNELLQGYSVSLLLITLTLVIGFGSVYFGILSVLPNLLPATMVFGFWAILVGQLDPFVMMLFSISIGLVVDDTVHILSHYLKSRRNGVSQSEAVAHSILMAGPALTVTTMVLALGTTILIFANTIYFQQSAKLLVPIVILALVLDLIYLPTILKRFDNKVSNVSVIKI